MADVDRALLEVTPSLVQPTELGRRFLDDLVLVFVSGEDARNDPHGRPAREALL